MWAVDVHIQYFKIGRCRNREPPKMAVGRWCHQMCIASGPTVYVVMCTGVRHIEAVWIRLSCKKHPASLDWSVDRTIQQSAVDNREEDRKERRGSTARAGFGFPPNDEVTQAVRLVRNGCKSQTTLSAKPRATREPFWP